MDWWVVGGVVAVVVIVGGPPYAYFICKYAGAGWFAGIRSVIRHGSKGEGQ